MKTMFVPIVWLFSITYWFVNLNLTDKHGTKNLWGLIRPWRISAKSAKPFAKKGRRRFRRPIGSAKSTVFGIITETKIRSKSSKSAKIGIGPNQIHHLL